MEIIRAILVNLGVPLAGLQVFLWLSRRMRAARIEDPPIIPLFLIFATYGGWLMIFVTLLFWRWSGMGLIGLVYLMFIAPLLMAALAVILYRQRHLSAYHFGSFVASSIYPFIIALILVARVLR